MINNYELNKAIAKELGGHIFNGTVHILKGDVQVDYVNSWNDLMPLVVKYSNEINHSMQKLGDFDFWLMLDKDSQWSLAEYLLEALQDDKGLK